MFSGQLLGCANNPNDCGAHLFLWTIVTGVFCPSPFPCCDSLLVFRILSFGVTSAIFFYAAHTTGKKPDFAQSCQVA